MTEKLFTILCFFILSLLSASSVLAAQAHFFSDAFSFVGQDENGYVLFALENQRSLDGATYSAKTGGVLYDQYQGWINLVGTGEYENTTSELKTIPDSPMFGFKATESGGLILGSRVNDLSLRINPISVRMRNASAKNRREWGTAAALFSWQGRNIPGRVIYTKTTRGSAQPQDGSGLGDNVQSFSLAVQSGAAAAWQDIYLNSEDIRKQKRTRGFIDAGSRQASLIAPDLTTTEKALTWGFYRWGKAWKMSLQQVQADGMKFPSFAQLELHQVSRVNLNNWLLGGIALSVVEGTIEVNQQQIPVLGFARQVK